MSDEDTRTVTDEPDATDAVPCAVCGKPITEAEALPHLIESMDVERAMAQSKKASRE